jgi:transposase
LGTFILATNELHEARLPTEEMRLASKGHGGGPERGVRFRKDPWCCADRLFLKRPQRMMALGMVMGVALLVSALAEHTVRTTRQAQGESVPNQAGKPTQRPTMRRIFQRFEGMDLLVINTPEGVQQQVLNLKPVHRPILRLLGPNVEKCYLDSS